MSQIKVIPLGAGQDVGRSCVLVSLGGKNIMFDCGMHMGFNDERRFPDFSYISRTGKFTETIDCVIISHFHLDHCGALPFFTEICGYDGPVYMTHPTKAIIPILLEDYRKITTERKGETNFFTSENVKDCMKKVRAVNLNETIQVDEDLEIRAYYAGHVLGAAMFYVKCAGLSVIYTGDYNMTPDRHLGAATIDSKIRPTLLITETTYATTIRGSKRMREGNFLKKVHSTVSQGGKVLIPVFAIGRAQELCILLETYWERMGLSVPVYFSPGMTEKANMYYELFILWTNQKIKDTFVKQNMFDFKHIQPFVNSAIDRPGPMVLLATPGMLHAGTSLEAFKKWCGSDKNTCILPGFCVNGTVGRKVLDGQKNIEIDKNIKLTVRCGIESLSFSAHADSKGILQLIQQCEPQNVLLVHGEANNMLILKEKIQSDFKIPVYTPANGEIVYVNANLPIKADLSTILLKRQFYNNKNSPFFTNSANEEEGEIKKKKYLHQDVPVNGYMIVQNKTANIKVVDPSEVSLELGLNPHKIQFSSSFIIADSQIKDGTTEVILKSIMDTLKEKFKATPIRTKDSINCNSIHVSLNMTEANNNKQNDLTFSWSNSDDNTVETLIELLTSTFQLKPLLLESNSNSKPLVSPSPISQFSSPSLSSKIAFSPVSIKKEVKVEDSASKHQNLNKEQIFEQMKSNKDYSPMSHQDHYQRSYQQYPLYPEQDYHHYPAQSYHYSQYPHYPQQYMQPPPQPLSSQSKIQQSGAFKSYDSVSPLMPTNSHGYHSQPPQQQIPPKPKLQPKPQTPQQPPSPLNSNNKEPTRAETQNK